MNGILPLQLEEVSYAAGGRTLIDRVSLTLEAGASTIVLGANGAGKTTLLRMLHGLARLSEGKVTWNRPLAEAQTRQAFVFQTPVVLRRSVRDNIAFPLILRGEPRARARARAENWVARVGLGEMAQRPAGVLSGGEKQKLALARALIFAPDILFLDEPTANLDGRSMREIETILRDTMAEGTRILMATHNIGQARRLASEVIFLYRGLVHERKTAEDFFAAPQTAEATAFIKGDIVE